MFDYNDLKVFLFASKMKTNNLLDEVSCQIMMMTYFHLIRKQLVCCLNIS